MSDSIAILICIGLTFVAAGMVKGVVGMGLPTVAMGVLSLFMPPASAAAMLVVPSLVTNVWQLMAGPAFGALAKRLATMMLAILAGTLLGIGVLAGESASFASGGLARCWRSTAWLDWSRRVSPCRRPWNGGYPP